MALTLSGLAEKMLYGITTTQPSVFALSAAVLAASALAAGWLPARRASRVDPMVALRHESRRKQLHDFGGLDLSFGFFRTFWQGTTVETFCMKFQQDALNTTITTL